MTTGNEPSERLLSKLKDCRRSGWPRSRTLSTSCASAPPTARSSEPRPPLRRRHSRRGGTTPTMRLMTSFEFGEVVLVPFPFTDQTASKQRPAVIVSSDRYNAERPDLVILALTSRIREPLGIGEAPVEAWREAGLLGPSVMKPVIATLEQSLVRARLGRLVPGDVAALREVLRAIIG